MIALLLAVATSAPEPGMAPVYTADTYPTALVDRPLILPHATVEISPGLTLADNQFGTLGIGLGLADRVEIDVAGLLCTSAGSCLGTQQALAAGIAVALVDQRSVNLVVAATYSYLHTRNVDLSGPGINLTLAVRTGRWFQLYLSGGATYTNDTYFGASFAGIEGALELRFQFGPYLAIAPFIAPSLLKIDSPAIYAIPAGLRALVSPYARFDFGLEIEDTDLGSSATLASSSAAVSLFAAVRL